LRDITRGEELTIDYDLSFGEEHVFGDKELAADDEPENDRA
jgi:SET domain-containing protein